MLLALHWGFNTSFSCHVLLPLPFSSTHSLTGKSLHRERQFFSWRSCWKFLENPNSQLMKEAFNIALSLIPFLRLNKCNTETCKRLLWVLFTIYWPHWKPKRVGCCPQRLFPHQMIVSCISHLQWSNFHCLGLKALRGIQVFLLLPRVYVWRVVSSNRGQSWIYRSQTHWFEMKCFHLVRSLRLCDCTLWIVWS